VREASAIAADSTAERVALWRALHVIVDPPPHIFSDQIGLQLLAPTTDWRARPDMNPQWTSRMRASIVARARFVEDLLIEKLTAGIKQYVILGAGLDSFSQRRPEIAARLNIFEIDRPGPQMWKRQRLEQLGHDIPKWLHWVPVDFEKGMSWWEQLVAHGFDSTQPAYFSSTGVSMYLTHETNFGTLRQLALLAEGSTVVMSFLRPLNLVSAEDRPMFERAIKGAEASGTPFVSFFSPDEIIHLAQKAGFKKTRHISASFYNEHYFSGRSDQLNVSNGEELLVAEV
jgi:methyltransferase (TIGR00027 family)